MEIIKVLNRELEIIRAQIIETRRDFHQYPEVGWTEFRTAAKVAATLQHLGYEVQKGREVIREEVRMGVPSEAILEASYQKALKSGITEAELEAFKGGFTGVVGTLRLGEGPTVAMRFDMDAIKLLESAKEEHRPTKEGFSSTCHGIMHGCGHDGHTAVGLGVASILMAVKDKLPQGTIKLIFQPSEEGVRGAKSMAASGVLDDVDYVLACHVMANEPIGKIICASNGFLATTKLDVQFKGVPAHAGATPNQGNNALLAACTAVTNLHGISRHSEGASRINVGILEAGSDRNVIPDSAFMKVETRGETSEVNAYMRDYAYRIIKGAADMHSVKVNINCVGEAIGGKSDDALVKTVETVAHEVNRFDEVVLVSDKPGGSEDFSYMMETVQAHGGQAVYFMVGGAPVDTKGVGHHTSGFDFDEEALIKSASVFLGVIVKLLEA